MTTDKIRFDREKHIYYLGDKIIPSYSGICKDLGIIKPNPFYTDAAREEGISLHLWLGFLACGKTPAEEPDARIAGRVEGIRKFIKDTGFKIAGGEEPMYDPLLGFACTPDIYGYIWNWSWVIDAKRGAKLKSHRLQTVAQQIALGANGFRAQKRGVLYLRDNDYRLEEHTDSRDRANWRNIVSAYFAKKEYI